uniref:Reverse transcriptase domain-containing protein n=1 Tax=Nicotiana tabacum TaxID=4097 RepID=A0A1S4CU87_TOBAC|nr:PREDICTED: uncharacterized protein LOC107822745 [Nicotiana tabacum]
MALFQRAWEFIKADIMGALNYFHQHCYMVRSSNASFIALIPKKKDSHGEFSIRRAKSIPKEQTNRRCIIVANELLDRRLKSRITGILCKLDVEKAFDKVNWSYLLEMLKDMGFGDKLIKWIRSSLTTVKYFILVNMTPVGFFSPQKGIRQRDPLSHFLFILAIEGLSKILDKAKQMQWIEGFRVGSSVANSVTISHLLYADDTLIFCGADKMQV